MLLWTFSLLMRRTLDVLFEGEALLRRMNWYGLLDESQNKLDYVLALTVENFLERRLQTLVFKSGWPSRFTMLVCLLDKGTSGLGGKLLISHPSCVKRKNQRAAAKKAAG
ncbi:hypothetical protein GQ457_05G017910 [Hibiscus cannabinus]